MRTAKKGRAEEEPGFDNVLLRPTRAPHVGLKNRWCHLLLEQHGAVSFFSTYPSARESCSVHVPGSCTTCSTSLPMATTPRLHFIFTSAAPTPPTQRPPKNITSYRRVPDAPCAHDLACSRQRTRVKCAKCRTGHAQPPLASLPLLCHQMSPRILACGAQTCCITIALRAIRDRAPGRQDSGVDAVLSRIRRDQNRVKSIKVQEHHNARRRSRAHVLSWACPCRRNRSTKCACTCQRCCAHTRAR
jgi:hypothetical protein